MRETGIFLKSQESMELEGKLLMTIAQRADLFLPENKTEQWRPTEAPYSLFIHSGQARHQKNGLNDKSTDFKHHDSESETA